MDMILSAPLANNDARGHVGSRASVLLFHVSPGGLDGLCFVLSFGGETWSCMLVFMAIGYLLALVGVASIWL